MITVAAGAGDQATAAAAYEHLDTCHSNTAVMYGYRMSCLKGARWDRLRSGSYDETFAIRSDGEVMHAWPGHGSWSPVSNGVAANVTWVILWPDHSRTVCVQTRNKWYYESRYDPHTQRWGTFHGSCAT